MPTIDRVLERLVLKIARNDNLFTLPQIVNSVLRTINDDSASGLALERIAEKDPAIAAKILRAANSTYYGYKNVTTLGKAISLLGLNTIRSLIVGFAFNQMVSLESRSLLFDKHAYWKHSLGVATAARMIARKKMPLKAEELYSAGILHDLGVMVLDRYCSAQLDHAVKLSFKRNLPLHLAEREVFGYDHLELGARLAEKWSLPERIGASIAHHLDPLRDDKFFESTSIIAMAEIISQQFGLPNNCPEGLYKIDPLVEKAIDLSPEQIVTIGKTMHEEIARASESFQVAA